MAVLNNRASSTSISPMPIIGPVPRKEAFRKTQQGSAFGFGASCDICHAVQRRLDVLPEFNGLGRGDPYGLHSTASLLSVQRATSLVRSEESAAFGADSVYRNGAPR